MRTLAEINADFEGPIAAMAATLRQMGKTEPEVEEVITNVFRIEDAGARRALRRLLATTLVAESLRRKYADVVFDEGDYEAPADEAETPARSEQDPPPLEGAAPRAVGRRDPSRPRERRVVARSGWSGRPAGRTTNSAKLDALVAGTGRRTAPEEAATQPATVLIGGAPFVISANAAGEAVLEGNFDATVRGIEFGDKSVDLVAMDDPTRRCCRRLKPRDLLLHIDRARARGQDPRLV